MNTIISDILIAFPFAFFLSMMIGPVFFVLLETSISKGFRAALTFNTGVVIADIVFISIAYLSSYRLIQSIKDEPALFIFGGIIMFFYGLISFFKLKKNTIIQSNLDKIPLNKKNYLGLFVKGFLLNFINIGVLGFWLGIIITIGPRLQMNIDRIILFFASVIFFYFLIDIGKISLAKQLKHRLNSTSIYNIKRWTSFILIFFGFVLSLQGFFPDGKEFFINYFNL